MSPHPTAREGYVIERAAPDGAQVAFVLGDRLVTIAVQGGQSAAIASSAAVGLAALQAALVLAFLVLAALAWAPLGAAVAFGG